MPNSGQALPYSPDIRFFNKEVEVKQSTVSLRKRLDRPLRILNVGGRHGEQNSWFPEDSTVVVLDLPGASNLERVLVADICDEALTIDDQFDIVFSHEVFEHLSKPWIASRNCIKFCRVGGLNIHIAPFAWRYHPVPLDCFRYSHTGFESLFTQDNNIRVLVSGYDISDRRGGRARQHGFWRDWRDFPPADALGGWLENWDALIVALKSHS